jgi:hypothetical protein
MKTPTNSMADRSVIGLPGLIHDAPGTVHLLSF